ncbi:MAG: type 1 glutamine amidotransferase domain-containing protein [Pseudomonadota bacterium]
MPSVLMIVANPATSPVTGWPIGFWWAELTHAWYAFTEAGYDVTITSPEGGALEGDAWSDPEHESGYAAHDILSLGFKKSPTTAALIADTKPLSAFQPGSHDAIFIAGGQAPMVNMIDNAALHSFVAAHYAAGRITAAVCHGTCVLLKTRLEDGTLLVDGKTWTGFANSEERYAEGAAGQKIQPFWIEDEAKKIEATSFITGPMLTPFAVRDGHLITGQQQVSAAATAAKVIEALGR